MSELLVVIRNPESLNQNHNDSQSLSSLPAVIIINLISQGRHYKTNHSLQLCFLTPTDCQAHPVFKHLFDTSDDGHVIFGGLETKNCVR